MSLQSEILPYIDGNGLVAPNLVAPGTKQGSDNGVMFTCEYLVMSEYGNPGPTIPFDAVARDAMFSACIGSCYAKPGLLSRAPGDPEQEQVDDYYALCSAFKVRGWRSLGRQLVWHGLTRLGFFNNSPSFTWDAFLWRQPQLVAAMSSAAELGWVPLFWSAYLWAAVVILFSCRGKPTDDADSRRLAWHLVQATQDSVLTKAVAWVWYRRLYKAYPDGMKGVAKVYYQAGHPFQKYWVDKRP